VIIKWEYQRVKEHQGQDVTYINKVLCVQCVHVFQDDVMDIGEVGRTDPSTVPAHAQVCSITVSSM